MLLIEIMYRNYFSRSKSTKIREAVGEEIIPITHVLDEYSATEVLSLHTVYCTFF